MAIREKHDGQLAGRMDVRVWLRLLSCSTIIEKRLRRRFADQYDTTLPRFDVLATLERHAGGVTMGELSRALLVSNGNVTALVRQLEGQGLVSTRSPDDDRRSSIVALTEQGRAHFAELAAAHHGWIKAMFAGVSGADLRTLYGLLATLKASIADEAIEDAEAAGAGGRERE
ncbi:MarR family winged helix-turn-helix transcriptional regulator [Sphingobium sp. TKS]|uniref:MarR family winged helix-turn-helix transcriptional regulator n=1 Tax=Sphingobium sp. TKS TaxID=1315974 RepID=UPI00077032FE|nr:MarR family transcriptional regulator [Sphingobium sp. TKS]AMK23226.1 MarR family transcriptional regulator [Sphingobium sp. TKS]